MVWNQCGKWILFESLLADFTAGGFWVGCSIGTKIAWIIFESTKSVMYYRVFHGFGQAKFAYGGSILSSSQFTLMPKSSALYFQNTLKKIIKIQNGQLYIYISTTINDLLILLFWLYIDINLRCVA